MARIRTIKPEFPHSESMGKISRDARLAFIMLWTIADDYGRLRGNSRMLASLLFPYDDDGPKLIDQWLGELEREACIARYCCEGSSYIQVLHWSEHQRVDKPSQSKIPDLSEGSRILTNSREPSCEDQGPRTKDPDQRTKEGSARTRKVSLAELSVDHIAEWLARKRGAGKYARHDEHFVLEQFRDYCTSKGKKYDDYIAAYRNAFEWDRCQPKPGADGRNPHAGKATWDSEARRVAAEFLAEDGRG